MYLCCIDYALFIICLEDDLKVTDSPLITENEMMFERRKNFEPLFGPPKDFNFESKVVQN